MSDAITDRIADVITDHHWYCTAGEPWPWQKGALLVCSAAGCDATYGNLFEFDAHVAEVIVEQLGLTKETRINAMSSAGMTIDHRTGEATAYSDIRHDRRYVTKWETE